MNDQSLTPNASVGSGMNLIQVVDDELLCPACGFNFTHVDRVEVGTASGWGATIDAGGEDELSYARARHTALTSIVGGHAGRRHTITLIVSCEGCDAVSTIAFGQHKGVTVVTVR